MNVISIACILLTAFFAVGFLTVQNTNRDIQKELSKTLDVHFKAPMIPNKEDSNGPESISYLAVVDKDKTILATSEPSFVSLNETVYTSLVEKVDIHKTNGYFQLNGRYFAYKVQENAGKYKIAFLDINQQSDMLKQMMMAFGLVSVISLVVVVWFSNYFAGRAIAPIQSTFKKQQDFVSDASHELKTPLTIISTNVDAMLSSGEDTISNQRRWLDNIQDEVKRTTKLTNSLLYLSRSDEDYVKQHQIFDFSLVVEEVCLMMEVQAFEKQLQLEPNIAHHVQVNGQKELLEQVVVSLLENALKYSEANSTIHVQLQQDGKYANLRICNPSPTLPKEKTERLFERFYRADADRNSQTGGHGLRLSICQRIVEIHKGTIQAISVNDMFTIKIQLPHV